MRECGYATTRLTFAWIGEGEGLRVAEEDINSELLLGVLEVTFVEAFNAFESYVDDTEDTDLTFLACFGRRRTCPCVVQTYQVTTIGPEMLESHKQRWH